MTSTERTDVGTAEDLHASASRASGLTDFGTDDYSEALEVLLESYRRDAELTPLGSKMSRFFLRGALVARLLSESAWKQYPEHAEVSIERPIFVTGLPRTGTTALHRLLTADPAHQGLAMWLTECSHTSSRASRNTTQNIPSSWGCTTCLPARSKNAGSCCANRCNRSPTSAWRTCRRTPRGWPSKVGTNAYARHRRNLQLIGLHDSERRWVLKNPSHLFALEDLLTVYPDALVIQTHREARTIMPSTCSLAEHATAGWSTKFTGSVIGRTQLDLWERGLHTFAAARAEANPAQFFDVDYHEFVADPLGTVEQVYRHFGLGMSEDARLAMDAIDAESRTGARRPSHKYTLEEFGLDGDEVDRRFGEQRRSGEHR